MADALSSFSSPLIWLIVAAIWYLAVVTVLSIGQHFLERHFSKAHRRARVVMAPAAEGA